KNPYSVITDTSVGGNNKGLFAAQ
ncbi:hypothetical protein L3Q82_015358, partial [Scortum barcoo]